MATAVVSNITALQAQAQANYFLLTQVGDRFVADDPVLDSASGVWRVPVLHSYPGTGPLGKVGEIWVSTSTEDVTYYTPIAEIKEAALALYEKHHDEVEAPLS